MDRELLCDSLVTWLQTFNVEGANGTVEELTDGVAMAHALHQIAPNFFTESWLTKIKVDVAGNWRLKVSNLKKILKGILDYYSEVLNQHINDFHMPDVNALGETIDTGELGRLLQLILGCAVNCDEKQEYIQRIMAMEESVQHGVMNAIQELMTKEAPGSATEGSSEIGDQMKRTMEELNRVVEAKEEISQRCHELDLQVAALQEEKASLSVENDRLNERINQADSLEDPSLVHLDWRDWPEELQSTPAGRRYQQLQNQVEQLQEELYRVETARDDLKIKVELQEKENLDLHQKNEDLNTLADEARGLKDEMDVLRHTSDKVTKYEQVIDTYKKKLEEMSDLKGQVKMLEEKNTSYMQKNMDLEEDLRKSGALKSQLELYKRQVQELQIKSSEETRRADKAEFEAKRVQEKMTAAQREKERLIAERDSLKETNEELRCTQVQKDSLQGEADPMSLDGAMVDMLAIPPEIKERLIRLQHENKMLKLQRAASEDDQSQVLQTILDDTTRRNSELESEGRIQNQRILELEAQLEDLRESTAGSAPSEEVADLRRNIATLTTKMTTQEAELRRRVTHEEELDGRVASQAQQVAALQDTLNKKDEEMRVMEERYKRYLEKCKSVSTQTVRLNPGKNSGTQTSVAVLARAEPQVEPRVERLRQIQSAAPLTKPHSHEKLVVKALVHNEHQQSNRSPHMEKTTPVRQSSQNDMSPKTRRLSMGQAAEILSPSADLLRPPHMLSRERLEATQKRSYGINYESHPVVEQSRNGRAQSNGAGYGSPRSRHEQKGLEQLRVGQPQYAVKPQHVSTVQATTRVLYELTKEPRQISPVTTRRNPPRQSDNRANQSSIFTIYNPSNQSDSNTREKQLDVSNPVGMLGSPRSPSHVDGVVVVLDKNSNESQLGRGKPTHSQGQFTSPPAGQVDRNRPSPRVVDSSPEPGCLNCCVDTEVKTEKPAEKPKVPAQSSPNSAARAKAQTLPAQGLQDRQVRSPSARGSTLPQRLSINRPPPQPRPKATPPPPSPGPVFTRVERRSTLLPHLMKMYFNQS